MITLKHQKIKKIDLIRELEKYPIFNLKVIKEIIKKDPKYTKLVVYRLRKEKLIFKIERNKYTTKKDPFIIASYISWPCYLSFWSALRYYNLTEQLPPSIFVITSKKRKKKELKFNNTKIIFTRIKPKYFFGYKKERYNDFDIFIAEKEKALIDSILFKKISFSEIYGIFKSNLKSINIDLFVKYLIMIKNKSLIKRVGFLLDSLGINKYNQFKKFINFKYIPLDYTLPIEGKKNKKWKVIENVNL